MSKYIDNYLEWLKSHFSENKLENRIEITVPFLDRNDEPLRIYAEEDEKEGIIYLTDDGYIIEDLLSCGCDVKTSRRNLLMYSISGKYKIDVSDDYELYTYTTLDQFNQKLHDLIRCMIAINNLHITFRKNNTAIFLDDIKDYFDLK